MWKTRSEEADGNLKKAKRMGNVDLADSESPGDATDLDIRRGLTRLQPDSRNLPVRGEFRKRRRYDAPTRLVGSCGSYEVRKRSLRFTQGCGMHFGSKSWHDWPTGRYVEENPKLRKHKVVRNISGPGPCFLPSANTLIYGGTVRASARLVLLYDL